MRRGDAATLGLLMNQSHASLRDDYEVSSDALNAMVEVGGGASGLLRGADDRRGLRRLRRGDHRRPGGRGFCRRTWLPGYQAGTGHAPAVYVCQATNGAEVFAGELGLDG